MKTEGNIASKAGQKSLAGTLKAQLTLRFVAVILTTTLICALVGVLLIDKGTRGQARDRVRAALNSAREILSHRLETIGSAVYLTSTRFSIRDALLRKDRKHLQAYLEDIREKSGFDFFDITDEKGNVVARAHNPGVFGDNVGDNEIIAKALRSGATGSSIEILSREMIRREGEDIVSRCSLTSARKPQPGKGNKMVDAEGMTLMAVSPVVGRDGNILGVLYGGEVLNCKEEIVDRIKGILFQNERYRGRETGVVTLFLKDVRISTNFRNEDGSRGIGSKASDNIADQVLRRGRAWIGEASVIHKQYLTAYEPIRNGRNEIIGMLAVGVLDQLFTDLRRQTLTIFLGVTFFGVILAIAIAGLLSNAIVRPVRRLVSASRNISEGDFSIAVTSHTANEIGELERAFNLMASSLRIRDEEIRRLNEQHLMRSEKLASIGRLAAGIAHEINNPLTSVLTFSSLLLRKAGESQKERLEIIIKEATRCREIVKGLLNFARQNEPRKEPSDINGIIENALSLTNQLKLSDKHISVIKKPAELPRLHVDPNQILEVFVNIIINAIDAMGETGRLTVSSRISDDGKWAEIVFSDTGHGIAKDDMEKIFDPFFTTKEAGKGTGLGLAVTYGIIEKHRGDILVESVTDKGTTFIVKLPLE